MKDNSMEFTVTFILGLLFGIALGMFMGKGIYYKEGQVDCLKGNLKFKPISKVEYIWKD